MRVVNKLRDDSGAVLVWVAGMMVTLIVFGGLAVDAGYGYVVKRDLSSTADSASLAGAQAAAEEYAKHSDWSGCDAGIASSVQDEVDAAVADNVAKNHPTDSPDVEPVDVSCNGEAIDVEVALSDTVPTFLMQVWPGGADTMTPHATAVAEVSGSPTYGGVRPFALCADTFSSGPQADVNYQVVYPQSKPNPTATCGTTSGNFYLLKLDPGDGGTPYLGYWTHDGYPYEDDDPEITFPPEGTTIYGNTGANFGANQVTNALDYLVDNQVTILLPVFDGWEGNGANGNIHATGAVPIKVCGYSTQMKDDPDRKNLGCGWDEAKYDAAVTAAKAAHENPKFIFQFEYAEGYTAPYDDAGNAEACELGPTCIPAIRLVK